MLAFAGRGPAWAAYVDALPRTASALLEEWQLTVDGRRVTATARWSSPCADRRGRPAVLKVGFPHDEAEHEHLALQHWHGRGAVRLLRADPRRAALLLERLHPEDLGGPVGPRGLRGGRGALRPPARAGAAAAAHR